MRFKYGMYDILAYFFRCGCLRREKNMAKDPSLRKHVLFEKGSDKLNNELDCITLLKAIRNLKLIS
jgi:hypothetical protein